VFYLVFTYRNYAVARFAQVFACGSMVLAKLRFLVLALTERENQEQLEEKHLSAAG
jgi:hypothetical protein